MTTSTLPAGYTAETHPQLRGPYGLPASTTVRFDGIAIGDVAHLSGGYSPAPYVLLGDLDAAVAHVIAEHERRAA